MNWEGKGEEWGIGKNSPAFMAEEGKRRLRVERRNSILSPEWRGGKDGGQDMGRAASLYLPCELFALFAL